MSVEEAKAYHLSQVSAFHKAGVDMVSAVTMNYINEATGIVEAAREVGLPVVISFTCETNGCLITGESVGDAIEAVDKATDQYAAYFMINCAHPTHFLPLLQTVKGTNWISRIGGIRANASKMSQAELDEVSLEESQPSHDVEAGEKHV